ncbi:DUF7504 family protein [Halobellus limi]|jgi:hypothetical protein|uniref:Halobacterial output domain-containing protein n=1 Tax=Halobellus limi TaxID=699433 RepID=A0A1H5ZVK3_9EURY|nr:hypothetical protein [Halobellus limi]QCC47925.1 hypothetical protein DV707_09780 [Halobellus limi]SEG40182.1 hypothetical protein SAMN04488133_2201 [Halobellus limi]
MHTGGGTDGSTVGATVGVATALDDLKSRGSALLVVGTVPEDVYNRVSACLLGGDADADRRRLVVERGSGSEIRFDRIDRWTPEWTRILSVDVAARSSAADASGAAGDGDRFGPGASPGYPSPTASPTPTSDSTSFDAYGGDPTPDDATVTVEGSIVDLGVEIGTAIREFDAVAGDLDPGELRVAFDCVAALLSEYDRRTVFRFLHVLANDVRSVEGMGHVRVPEPIDSEVVRLFAPLFDAIVELRLDGREPQQRWHLRDADLTSEWLPVDDGR